MTLPPRIVLVGLGDLGGQVLGMLMRMPFPKRLVVAGRDVDGIRLRVRLQQYTTLQHDRWEPVDVVRLDVREKDAAAETLARLQPDVVFNAMSLQSWRIITELPRPVFEALDQAQFGPWLPMHLAPARQLMQAVDAAGLRVHVVNAAFPDAVNPILATQRLAPSVGIGNVANIIPALRCAVAHLLGRADPTGVEVMLYAQHYFTHSVPRFGTAGGAPFLLRAFADLQDVTEHLDIAEVLRLVATTFRRQGGREGQLLTAGSAVRVLQALVSPSPRLVHAPGPGGRPGGYCVRADAAGVSIVVPDGVTLDELVRINEAGQACDGIERIDPDGTVSFRAENMDVLRRMLGYSCSRMRVADVDEAAKELGERYQEFARRHAAGPA